MKSFSQYISELLEEVQIKKNPKRMPRAEWHDILQNPNSVHAPTRDKNNRYSETVTPEMLSRIRAWHNPPEQMDVRQFQTWARNLGFGTDTHDPITKGAAEFDVVLKSPSGSRTNAMYMSDGKIRIVSVSNQWQDRNRKDLIPHIVKNLRDSAIRHGHVPSNVHDFVHQEREKPRTYTEQERILEKQQAKKVMDAYRKTRIPAEQVEKTDLKDLPSAESLWSDWNNLNPETLIGHARNLLYSIDGFHINERKMFPRNFHPKGEVKTEFWPPHPRHEPGIYLVSQLLRPHKQIKLPYARLQNHYLNIVNSAERMGLEVPDNIHHLMRNADMVHQLSSKFEGREEEINRHIHGMLRYGQEYKLPESPTGDKDGDEYLKNTFNDIIVNR